MEEPDQRVLERIRRMVADERRLRDSLATGDITGETEQERMAALERELDQCWDLLRQRRAKTEFGADPGEARVRPSSEVEGYQS